MAAVVAAAGAIAAPRAGAAQPTDAAWVRAARADTARTDTARTDRARADSAAAGRRGWEVTPFVGYARRSPVRFWGHTPDRNHMMLGVQFARPVGRAGPFTVAYAPNVVPVFVLTNNPRDRTATRAPDGPDGRARLVGCESVRCGPVYGVGAAPAGLRLEARPLPGLGIYGAAAAGLVWFSRNVPVAEARRLNATAEWGGGLVIKAVGGAAVQLGYKYHHTSNGYTAPRNPGVDGHVLYAGVRWREAAAAMRR